MRNGAAAPTAEQLKWKERRLQSNNPFSGWGCHLPSFRGEVGMEVTEPSIHVEAGWCPSGYNWSQLTYLCNCGNLWQVAFLKLVSFCREPVCLFYTQAVCAAGTSSEGTPERSISILFSPWRYCTHKAGGYVSRLIYLFYFGLEKTMPIGVDTCFAFAAEPAASPVASLLCGDPPGIGVGFRF